jgi:hypothetical protein
VAKNVKGVKLRARATGILIGKSLDMEAQLKRARQNTISSDEGSGDGGDNTAITEP